MFKDGPVADETDKLVETATDWAQDPVVAAVGETMLTLTCRLVLRRPSQGPAEDASAVRSAS
jgi:hypothetical protein